MGFINSSYKVIALALLIICSGCATVYVPNSAHIPFMEERGEIHISAQLGSNGGNLQLGYALLDQFGMIASISGRERRDEDREKTAEHIFGEAAVVWFPNFHSQFRHEFLGGVGFGSAMGKTSFTHMDNNAGLFKKRAAKGDFSRIFVQVNTALTSSDITTGFATRLAYVNFYNFELISGPQPTGESTSALFFEPAIFFKMGSGNVKFESQFGFTSLLGDARNIAFDYATLRASFGVHIYLNTR